MQKIHQSMLEGGPSAQHYISKKSDFRKAEIMKSIECD